VAQAAALLRDLPAAWDKATAEQRNDLARLVFQSVEIRDDRVVAVLPTPEFAPFFNLAEDTETGRLVLSAPDRQTVLSGGSDGDRFVAFRRVAAGAPPRRRPRCLPHPRPGDTLALALGA
jgi:hypothetical protein